MGLSLHIKDKFSDLASQLSPENLSCDGELPRDQLRAKADRLKKQWAALEKLCGVKVREDDVWSWQEELNAHHAKLRQAELDKFPDHPMLEKTNPGVWSRLGAACNFGGRDKQRYTLYYIQKYAERKVKIGNTEHVVPASECYTLYCDFARTLYKDEILGEYETLEDCVAAGEEFLKEVTFESFKALTQWSDDNIRRELAKLG